MTQTMTSRADHMAWCKKRALAYVDAGDPSQAWASMASDLRKHPATEDHPGVMLGMGLMMTGGMKTAEQVRRFIEGFN